MDSFGSAASQPALSTPPVFRTWPASVKTLVTPSTVTSTSGCTFDCTQTSAQSAPFGPTSEVSNDPSSGHPSSKSGPIWVSMSWPPTGTRVPCGQMSNAQVPKRTTTESTVTSKGVLLTTRTAPASRVQLAQPWNTTPWPPAHGVGNRVGLARASSAYPTYTWTLEAARAPPAGKNSDINAIASTVAKAKARRPPHSGVVDLVMDPS